MAKVYPTQTGVRIIVPGQGIPGPPGLPGAPGPIVDVETLPTQGALGTVPTSLGPGNGLSMQVPAGGGNVVSPGSETAGNISKFTGTNSIAETATTETELATAVTHSEAMGGNPHNQAPSDIGAEAEGVAANLIVTHESDANAHHPESHTIVSHDTFATGAQLNTLTDGSNADLLHAHADPTILHSSTTGQTPNDHHNELHTVASHSDTTATGDELNTLTSGANADLLHVHAAPSIAHSATTGQTANDHHDELHTVASHSDTTATGPQLNTLVGGGDASSLHTHPHNIASHTDTTATGTELDTLTGGPASDADALHTHPGITGGGPGSDTTAIHDNEANEISAITEKVSPGGGDFLIIEDNSAGNIKKRVQVGNLPTGGGGESNLIAGVGTLGQSLVAAVPKAGITLQTKHVAPTSPQIVVTADANDNVLIDVDGVQIPIITKNSGFEDSTDVASLLSKVDGTRTFTITPTGADFKIWVQGVRFVISGAQNVVWPDTTGTHHFYFDAAGTLQTAPGPVSTEDQGLKGLVAAVYWDAVGDETLLFTTERHGFQQSPDTRRFLHATVAALWSSGLGLGITSIDGTGDDEDNGHIIVADGDYYDENLPIIISDGAPQDLTPLAQIPVFWLSGTEGTPILNKRAATNFPFINVNDTVWPNARVPFNELTGGNWLLTEVTNNDFCLFHIFATGDINTPIISVHGQAEYTSLSLARDGATDELTNLVVLGIAGRESVPLGTVILQSSTGYANSISARIVSTLDGDYVDWRTAPRVGGGTGSVNEHNQLAGRNELSNHTQYLDLTGTRLMLGDFQINANDVTGGITLGGTLVDVGLFQYLNEIGSAGFFGDPLSPAIITPNGINFDVATGVGAFHTGAAFNSALGLGDWPAALTNAIPLNSARYVGVEWNAGTPQVVVKTTNSWTLIQEWPLGIVIRDSNSVRVTISPPRLSGFSALMAQRVSETDGFARSNGLDLQTSGLNVSRLSGRGWVVLTPIDYVLFDSSGADNFDIYLLGATNTVVEVDQSSFEDQSFDNGTDTKATLNVGRYGVRWVYMDLDTGDISLVYGTTNANDAAVALAEEPPGKADLPPRLQDIAFLLGRIIFVRGAGAATDVADVWDTSFSGSGGGDGDVSGPAGGVVSGEVATYADATGKAIAGSTGLLAANISQVGHTHDHATLTNVTADQHHAEVHTIVSHDTTATGANLNTLTDASNADALHVHDHSILTGVGADDHHAESHTVASHSDTTATGTQINALVGSGNADSLHTHADFSDSTFRVQDNADPTKEIAFEASGVSPATVRTITMPDADVTLDSAGDTRPPAAHTIESHTGTSATGAQLDTLTNSSNADALHLHADFDDATFRIQDNADPTKELAFQVSGVSPATVRTVTIPDADILLDDASAARPPNGTAGGQLGGTYPNPTVNDGADGSAIHVTGANQITGITEKVVGIVGDDEFVIDDDGDSANIKSIKARRILRPLARFVLVDPWSNRVNACALERYPYEVLCTRLNAFFPVITDTNTFQIEVFFGPNPGSRTSLGTVDITAGTQFGTNDITNTVVPANDFWFVDIISVGTFTGSVLSDRRMKVTAETELN